MDKWGERKRAKEGEGKRWRERGGESDIVMKREGEKIFYFQSQMRTMCSYKIVQMHRLKC